MPLAAGDVVVLPFPYTDVSSSKQRPALVGSPGGSNEEAMDGLFASVTSVEQPTTDPFALPLQDEDLSQESLVKESWIRSDKLFTIEQGLVRKTVARLDEHKLESVPERIGELIAGKDPT